MKLFIALSFLLLAACTDGGFSKATNQKEFVEGQVSPLPIKDLPVDQDEPSSDKTDFQPIPIEKSSEKQAEKSPEKIPEKSTPIAEPLEDVAVNYNINNPNWYSKLKTGDVVFINGTSQQSDSIIEATGSLVTHMGMIIVKEGAYFVAEAVQPVKLTPLEKFVTPHRVKNERLLIKRLDESKLPIKISPTIEHELLQEFYKYNNKNYDSLFQWSDEKIYCSELVYKIFKKVLTIDVGTVVYTKELNMGPAVINLIKQRFNVNEGTIKFNNVYDKVMNEKIITPVSMFESEYFLKTPIIDFSKSKLK